MTSVPLLVAVFAGAAVAVYVSGVRLSAATDVLSVRWGLGEELGGLVVLAVVTNLPELVITTSAALSDNLGLAVGNILGGIAVQTVVLVSLDAFGVGKDDTLTYRAASLVLVLEGALVVAVLGVTIMGSQLPASLVVARVTPAEVLIVLLWVGGVWLLAEARNGLPWHEQGTPPEGQAEPRGTARRKKQRRATNRGKSTAYVVAVLLVASAVTMAGGVALERTSTELADTFGIGGAVFGATALAAVTSLPEISTGLTSVRLGDYQLAVSDIFGGNAFLPVLFLLASLLSGRAVLPDMTSVDVYLTALGCLLTTVYIAGLIFRPRQRIARMGVDSVVVLTLYVVGMAGLFLV